MHCLHGNDPLKCKFCNIDTTNDLKTKIEVLENKLKRYENALLRILKSNQEIHRRMPIEILELDEGSK